MNKCILFLDVVSHDYLPVVRRVASRGFTPIMNGTPLAGKLRASGMPFIAWETLAPSDLKPRVQREVNRIADGLANTLRAPGGESAFSSPLGSFIPHTGQQFFTRLLELLAGEIANVEMLDSVARQWDLRLIVLGFDNSHAQRAVVNYARRLGIPSLNLSHGVAIRSLARSAGEMHTVYADCVAEVGQRSRDILVELGNSPERILVPGAVPWDPYYRTEAKIDRREARRRLGLDPERPVVLFCTTYAEGASAFYPAHARRLLAVHRAVADAVRRAGAELQLITRPHPHELRRALNSSKLSPDLEEWLLHAYGRWLSTQGIGQVQVSRDQKVEAIRAADVVLVLSNSSVIPEAMILERPIIMLPFLKEEKPTYTGRDGIAFVEEDAQLPGVLAGLLSDPERRAAMVERQRAVLPELNQGNDGRAAERLADLIANLANESKRAPALASSTRTPQEVRAGQPSSPEETAPELSSMEEAPASRSRGRAGLRVLLAYRSDVDGQGGAAGVMRETARALQKLGVQVDVTYDVRPDLQGYDLVHAFNVWHPRLALEQLQYLRSAGVPIVWSPIYLHWTEYAWARHAVRVLFDAQRSEEERQRLQEAASRGLLEVNGIHRWAPNEVYAGFHRDLRQMVDCVDHLCVTSHREVQMLAQTARWTSKPFTVTPHGVEAEPLRRATADPFRSRFGIQDFVLCVGAVDVRKNQLMLVEALKGTGLKLVLAGPSFEPDYLEMCTREGGEQILYTDRLDPELVASAYKACRVHALPSFAEGAALANLEAAVAGRAMVVSNRSSEFEYFGGAPYYCDPGDVASIREAVLRAYDGYPMEKTRWETLSQEVQERFTWARTAELTLQAYERTLGRDLAGKDQAAPLCTMDPAIGVVHDGVAVDGRVRLLPNRPGGGGDGLGGTIALPTATPSPGPDEPLSARLSEAEICWGASIFDFSGYSRLSRQSILALDRRGIPQSIEAYGKEERFLAQLEARPDELATWQRLSRRRVDKGIYVCFHPPTNWDGCDIYAFYRPRHSELSARVGLCMFETDRLPAGWAAACNGMDEIWVPSTFNRETFTRAGVEANRLQVIPFGIDTRAYNPDQVAPMEVPGRRGFTFLSVFQWNKRKGWDVLLKAYLTAFTPKDDVCLVLRTYPDQIKTPPIRERIQRHAAQLGYDPRRIPPIILLEDFIPEEQMPALFAAADAFVLPTRGEGWGIPFMEAMAMGLPALGTRWSSHLDFMSDENSYLIDVEGLVPVDGEQTRENPFYTRDQRWAEPSPAHTAALMRHVYEHREEARARGGAARREIQDRWSLDRTTDWILQRATDLIERNGAACGASYQLSTVPVEPSLVPTPREPRVVLWHGPIYDPSGYADEARNFILSLQARGIHVAARAVARNSPTFREQLDELTRERLDRALEGNPGSDFVSVLHFPAYAFRRVPGAAYNVGRVMFETDGLPADWVAKCNQMDEIWVPTEFNLQTFRQAGVTTRLFKVPGGIDADRFRPDLEPLPIPGARAVVFLSVFEWIYRKGWDVLLRGWAGAFGPTDDVCLVLRTYPINSADLPDSGREIELRIDRFLQGELGLSRNEVAPILVLSEQVPEQDLPRLFAAARAYVAPSRGEGWGRPHMQAMACGLPVIATRWSGNLEFMNDENSMLLDVEGLVEIDDRAEMPFYRGQRWAEPSANHLAALLRRVVEDPEGAARLGRRARAEVKRRWTWEKVAAIAADRLRSIEAIESVKPLAGTVPAERLPSPQNLPSDGALAIRWEGSQFVHHSLALVNREICLGLMEGGHELSIIPYEPDQFGQEVDRRFSRLAARVRASLSRPADVHVRHQWPPNFTAPPQGHWVMIQPWEFGSIPRLWIEKMREGVDEVWAYTNYVREGYVASGMPADRVHLVPLGVDVERFRAEAPPLPLQTQKRFKFLFVGGTIWRKGPDVLLDAYLRAFNARDDVCLVIKDMGGSSFYRGQTSADRIRQIQTNPKAPEILLLTEDMAPGDLPGLYTACDCLVHPYRGEGFGLPIAEAMSCARPVIVTGAGAALDFCDESVAYLIPATRQQLAQKRIGEWETVHFPFVFEPDREATARLMRQIFENPVQAREVGARARRRICERFTWEHAAVRAVERIRALRARPVLRLQERAQQDVQPVRPLTCILTTHGGPPMELVPGLVRSAARPLAIIAAGRLLSETEVLRRDRPTVPEGWRLETSDLPLPALVNRSIQNSCDDPVLLLSADLALTDGGLDRMLAAFDRDPKVAAVGPTSNHAPKPQRIKAKYDGTGRELRRFADHRARDHVGQVKEVGYLASFCLALNPRIFPEVGPLREDLELLDALWDYFGRIRGAGYKIVVALDAYLHHDKLVREEGAGFDDLADAEEAGNRAMAEGYAALEREELETAAGEFSRAVELCPDLAAGQIALGSTLMALGRFEDALPRLRRAIELEPMQADLHNQLGVALYQTGDPEGAERAFRQGREVDPGNVQPLLNLVDLYRSQERYVEATEALKEALALDPNHAEVLVALGSLSLELGDLEGAEMALRRLQTTHPNHPEAEILRRNVSAVVQAETLHRGDGDMDGQTDAETSHRTVSAGAVPEPVA